MNILGSDRHIRKSMAVGCSECLRSPEYLQCLQVALQNHTNQCLGEFCEVWFKLDESTRPLNYLCRQPYDSLGLENLASSCSWTSHDAFLPLSFAVWMQFLLTL